MLASKEIVVNLKRIFTGVRGNSEIALSHELISAMSYRVQIIS